MNDNAFEHTFTVLQRLPNAVDGYTNPMPYQMTAGQKIDAAIHLTENSYLSNRLYVVDYEPTEEGKMTTLGIHQNGILSVFVGNNVSSLCLSGCASVKTIEFSDPESISALLHNCFFDISSDIEFDLGALTNLREIQQNVFGQHIRFPEGRLVIPSTVSSVESFITYHNTGSGNAKIDEIVFEPETSVTVKNEKYILQALVDTFDTDNVSCITLNDNAMYMLINEYLALGSGCSPQAYRKMYVDTLSCLHSIEPQITPLMFSWNTYQAADSGDIYTFHNYPLSDLEDQASDKFAAYESLPPKELFIDFIKSGFKLEGLSVWVPTALYGPWKAAWPNYNEVIHPYGTWIDPYTTQELQFESDKSYIIADKSSTEFTVYDQTGPATVTLSAFDGGDEVPSDVIND